MSAPQKGQTAQGIPDSRLINLLTRNIERQIQEREARSEAPDAYQARETACRPHHYTRLEN